MSYGINIKPCPKCGAKSKIGELKSNCSCIIKLQASPPPSTRPKIK